MGDDWDDCELFSSRMGGGCMMLDRYVMCVSLRKPRLWCMKLKPTTEQISTMASIGLEIGWEYGAWNCVYYCILYTLTVSTYNYIYVLYILQTGGVQTKSLVVVWSPEWLMLGNRTERSSARHIPDRWSLFFLKWTSSSKAIRMYIRMYI